ncbi:MAG: ABC transporter ATP-binding protein [Defluviitaleaceae bacterium]|nr:ABC transporter ATP-binding protein [Defluviitaleaceae bacterium]MCL2274172.1 ABC transporter ATP-binding protein [Defluviitaleaceae bacterium]
MNILEVRDLTKRYRSGKGIRGVHFDLPKGTILGIIGLNGAGKTTLLNCLTGFLKFDSGTVRYAINGEVQEKITPALLDDLGIVSSEYGFPDHFTAKTISRIMSATYRRWDAARFFEILAHLELEKGLRTSKYSSGMKTKLAIAIALSHNAKILILDEATRGLDVRASSRVRELLHNHVSNGENAIILTSHIMGEIERMSDTIMLVDDGNVQFISNKDDLLYEHKIFQVTSAQLVGMDKGDISKIKREEHAIYIIAKDTRAFAEKYKLDAVASNLDRVIELMLEGEAL